MPCSSVAQRYSTSCPRAAASTATARAVVTALLGAGVLEVVVAPGSRNAPLSFALFDAARAGLLRLHTRIDERSAAFLALGLTKVGARAAVVCTSGTAVANLHPALLEAAHAGVEVVAVRTVIESLDDKAVDAYDAYLRLHLLSHRLVPPHGLNADGFFGVLTNVVWTNHGPCAVEGFEVVRARLRRRGGGGGHHREAAPAPPTPPLPSRYPPRCRRTDTSSDVTVPAAAPPKVRC